MMVGHPTEVNLNKGQIKSTFSLESPNADERSWFDPREGMVELG
ncbi:hypothetical protein [Xanthomonas phage vB_XooS_NR08]|nr:hypothetical protein [Xanthomonas phage vB_XooS_NR08]